jgi:hypothetical protein
VATAIKHGIERESFATEEVSTSITQCKQTDYREDPVVGAGPKSFYFSK